MSSVAVARLISGRPCSRIRTRPAATIGSCRQASFIGPAIQRGSLVHARQCRTCPEARRRGLAHLACALPSSSHLRSSIDVDARSAVLHLDEAAVNGPSFCCRVHADSQRCSCESDSRTPNPLFRVSPIACQQKATISSHVRRKKCVRNEMRCIDATENRRDIAAAAVCSAFAESLSGADRSARTARSRGRCSWRWDGSACCRRAAR